MTKFGVQNCIIFIDDYLFKKKWHRHEKHRICANKNLQSKSKKLRITNYAFNPIPLPK